MAADPEIRFLGDLQRLERRPGDVFVMTVPDVLSRPAHERFREFWVSVMGETPLIILERGAKLGIVGGVEDFSVDMDAAAEHVALEAIEKAKNGDPPA